MAERTYIAVDMGASSGRHVAGSFDGRLLRLQELYRFENGAVNVHGRLYWDVLGQWQHVCQGLRAARTEYADEIVSVGVDTWGVDFGLLDKNDELLGNPHTYRDSRTDGMMEKAFAIVPREEIFAATGLQFMQFNSLYQLLSMKLSQSPLLEMAQSLLLIPDLFHWLLTGVKANEFTDASTSQMLDPHTGDWARGMLDRFGLHARITTLDDVAQRVEVVRRRRAFDADPAAFVAEWDGEQRRLQHQITKARQKLAAVALPDETLFAAANLCVALEIDGHRGELTLCRAAVALAALEGRAQATPADVARIATLALRHRLRKDPLETGGDDLRIQRAVEELALPS